MAYQKVQIVFNSNDWKDESGRVYALYNTYFDVAVPIDEEKLDKLLDENDVETMNEIYSSTTAGL